MKQGEVDSNSLVKWQVSSLIKAKWHQAIMQMSREETSICAGTWGSIEAFAHTKGLGQGSESRAASFTEAKQDEFQSFTSL